MINGSKININHESVLSNNDIICVGDCFKFRFIVNKQVTDEKLVVLDENNANDASVIYVSKKELEVADSVEQLPISKGSKNKVINAAMDDEFTCSICTDILIKAVALNCSHMFCQYCIGVWKKTNLVCPMCRAKITSETNVTAVDNFISRVIPF